MDEITARPRMLKQANLTRIRKVIMMKGTATRAEIAEKTKISSTTVRLLLVEMLKNGEIVSLGWDESSGGRKAERYGFQPERYHGVAFCAADNGFTASLVNLRGEIVETTRLEFPDGDYEKAGIPFLEALMKRQEIKAVGLGVPGVVEGGGYWKKRLHDHRYLYTDIGDRLSKRYGLPVVLENDLNATAIGFGQRYDREFPANRRTGVSAAYLHFEKGCVSAGFVAEGRALRGWSNFAGELGLIPLKGDKLLDQCMAEPMDDEAYTGILTQTLYWICGILNPRCIALSGGDLRAGCIGAVRSRLSALLPGPMAAAVLHTPDPWRDYQGGMAALTAAKIHDAVQLVKA